MFTAPNYTQTPNQFFDELMPLLKPGELKVLLVIFRQTFGWQKEWDRISITQLMEKSGLARKAVVNSTKSLITKKIIETRKEGKNGEHKVWFRLVVKTADSNNFDQYPLDTPTSILKIPTKETLTKEIKKKEIYKEKEESAPPPTQLFIFKKVKMPKEAYEKLITDFGAIKTNEMIERLDEYGETHEKNFKKYSKHAAVVRQWILKDNKPSAETNESINAQYFKDQKREFFNYYRNVFLDKSYVINRNSQKDIPLNWEPDQFKNMLPKLGGIL